MRHEQPTVGRASGGPEWTTGALFAHEYRNTARRSLCPSTHLTADADAAMLRLLATGRIIRRVVQTQNATSFMVGARLIEGVRDNQTAVPASLATRRRFKVDPGGGGLSGRIAHCQPGPRRRHHRVVGCRTTAFDGDKAAMQHSRVRGIRLSRSPTGIPLSVKAVHQPIHQPGRLRGSTRRPVTPAKLEGGEAPSSISARGL
jgi:hypothetical protein